MMAITQLARTARVGWLAVVLAAAAMTSADAQGQRGRGPQPPPEIAGTCTGTWSSFNPAQATSQPKQDGGVYDWVGRATNNEFIGFYTSAHATGFFNMTRAK